jgi:hypothetical protein
MVRGSIAILPLHVFPENCPGIGAQEGKAAHPSPEYTTSEETSCTVGAPLPMKKAIEAWLSTQSDKLLERRRPTVYCAITCF